MRDADQGFIEFAILEKQKQLLVASGQEAALRLDLEIKLLTQRLNVFTSDSCVDKIQ